MGGARYTDSLDVESRRWLSGAMVLEDIAPSSNGFIRRRRKVRKMAKTGSVHEPKAPLLSAEDAIEDAARLRARFRQQPPAERMVAERVVAVRMPLWALLEAMDHLAPDELQQVARRAEECLGAQPSR